MKNLILAASVLFVASCSGTNDGCTCKQQRWQRTVEYQGTTTNVIATTDWNAVDSGQVISSSDCTKNGTVGESGVVSSEILANGNTKKVEYEYRITCQ